MLPTNICQQVVQSEEMHKFLETYILPRLNQAEAENLKRQIMSNKIESVIKNFPTNQSPGPDGITGRFCQALERMNTYTS